MRDVTTVFENLDNPFESCPERHLFLGVLWRALMDVTGNDRIARREARAWFDAKERLLPYGVGWQDVIDLEYISASRMSMIEDILGTNYRRKIAA